MLFKKLWRTMGQYKAQFISMIIMIALGVGMFVGFNMEWASIEKNTSSFFKNTGYADFRIMSETPFSKDDLEKINSIDGVSASSRFISVNVDIADKSGNSVTLCVTENPAVSGFMLIEGEKYDESSCDGVWLSDKYASYHDVKIGDEIAFSFGGKTVSGKVAGLIKSSEQLVCVRDESQLMPDYASHGFAYISPEMYKNALGTEYYPQINVISDLDKKEFTEKVNETLSKTMLVLSKSESASYSAAEGEASEGKTMGNILPVLFLVIAVLTMVTTMHRLTVKEKTQIGTLKALGFKDRRILVHYTSYAFMIGVIGTLLGTALGYGIAWYIMNPSGTMGTYFDMPEWKLCMPWFCSVVLVGIVAALTLIGFLSTRKMLSGTAADALRTYTPKKMKPLAIEKTKLFHKFSFGTRWNMRDIMRHKSRTGMSLIGVFGCTVLIIASFGMKDTMGKFIDMYYNDAMNYASRIYMSDTASAEQTEYVIEKYKGDSSQSVSVELNDKAVSLDIYRIKNDKVRFPSKDGGYTKLGDDGAYICIRISDETGCGIGDYIEVSPYGSDDVYKLKVAGIIRSVSESIVITDKYAEKLGIDVKPTSVYTDTAKEDVKEDCIKNVQKKQDIMKSFDTFMEIMNSMLVVLIVGAVILGIVVLYNLGVMSYTERYREMATLKVVGFGDRRIGSLLVGQNMWVSAVGIIIGIPTGAAVLAYLLKAMAGDYEMKMYIGFASYAASILITLGVSLAVSLAVSRKNKKIDMVEALKGAE